MLATCMAVAGATHAGTAHQGKPIQGVTSPMPIVQLISVAHKYATPQQEHPAQELVMQLANELMDSLGALPIETHDDLRLLRQAFNERVFPHIDTRWMLRRSMARHWQNASTEQRYLLHLGFRDVLFNAYTSTLRAHADWHMEFKPFKPRRRQADAGSKSKTEDEGKPERKFAMVRSELIRDGLRVPIEYRLRSDGEQWQLVNIYVAGFNLIQQFRNHIDEQITAGGINGLIKSLDARNTGMGAGADISESAGNDNPEAAAAAGLAEDPAPTAVD